MPETPFTGLTASIKIGAYPVGVVIGYISGVTLSLDKDIIEILAFGMSFKEKVAAIKDWSISFDGTAAFAAGGGQQDLWDAYSGTDAITVGIFLDDTTYFEGSGLVQSLEIEAAPDDKINVSGEIAGTGAVAFTIPGTSADLTLTVADHVTVGATAVTVMDPALTGGNSYMVCVNGGLPAVGTDLTTVPGWVAYTVAAAIPCVNGARISIAEVSTGDIVVKRGQGIAVVT